MSDFDFEFDSGAVSQADRNAAKINESRDYAGKFTRVQALESAGGARGVTLEFESNEGGKVSLDLYTHGKEGQELFGYNQLAGLAFLLGAKDMKASPGLVSQWNEVEGKRVEVEGKRYPQLENKPIGIVLQKEISTNPNSGKRQERMQLYGAFDLTTKLTASEIQAKKTRPANYERLLKVKDLDKSKPAKDEPAQPGVGLPSGEY